MFCLPSICILFMTPAAVCGESPGVPPGHEPGAVYAIVATAAKPVLPVELHTFFGGRLDKIVSVAGKDRPGGAADAPTSLRDHVPSVARDFVDPGADGAGASEESFPRNIQRLFMGMREAFRSGRLSVIEPSSGRLLRFVTDAALPFRAAADADGTQTSNLSWADRGPPSSVRWDRSLRLRIELGAMPRLQKRLSYEVRVAPGRYARVSAPFVAALRVVRDTDAALESLRRADAEVMGTLDIVDAEGFESKREAYYRRFTQRAAPVLEDRLEAAVLLYANLVGTAWEDAGRPELGGDEPGAESVDRAADSGAKGVIHYVGSRHSRVFHKSRCPHARRIKPENRVRFDTVAGAVKAGRTPCRTCKPTP